MAGRIRNKVFKEAALWGKYPTLPKWENSYGGRRGFGAGLLEEEDGEIFLSLVPEFRLIQAFKVRKRNRDNG